MLFTVSPVTFVCILVSMAASCGGETIPITLTAQSGQWTESEVECIAPDAESFVIEALLDPVEAEGGDLQVVAGLVVGLKHGERVRDSECQVRVDLREGGERSAFTVWHRKTNLTMLKPNPRPPGWMDNRDDHSLQKQRAGSGIGTDSRPLVLSNRLILEKSAHKKSPV